MGKPCDRRRWDGTRLCSMPATQTLTAMCVHEHMLTGNFCDAHAADATTQRRACRPCHDSTQPHNCVVRVLDAAVT